MPSLADKAASMVFEGTPSKRAPTKKPPVLGLGLKPCKDGAAEGRRVINLRVSSILDKSTALQDQAHASHQIVHPQVQSKAVIEALIKT